MIPESRDELVDLCLRNLGAPVIDINVDSDQADDKVDEALRYYQQYHFNAIERFIMPHKITQQNIDDGFIGVSPLITSITKIVHIGGDNAASKNWMSALGQSMINMQWDIGFGAGNGCMAGQSTITDYELALMHIDRIQNVFGAGNTNFNFNYRSHKLNIFTDWKTMFAVDDYVVADTYRVIDPNVYNDIWGDEWLIEYVTCLIGRQWGVNLSKFSNVELPGGIMLDGDKIYDRYHERYLELRAEMSSKWELPVDFFVG